jgi:hypothetical protein
VNDGNKLEESYHLYLIMGHAGGYPDLDKWG